MMRIAFALGVAVFLNLAATLPSLAQLPVPLKVVGTQLANDRNERVPLRGVYVALHDHDWDWVAWDMPPRAGPRLISDWNYTPTAGFGILVKDALAGRYPVAASSTAEPANQPGIFEGHGDVGTVLHSGTVQYDGTAKTYTVSGSGDNMWSTRDAFHYVWKKASGDLALTADISFLGQGGAPHRKACLVIRQSLDPDAAYVDAALHGDGLTSLQFREAKGAATHEVQANVSRPGRLRIEKRGKYALLYLAAKGEELRFSGAAVRLALQEPFYIGVGVCAHDKDAMEKAVFSNVELNTSLSAATKPVLYSALQTQTIASTDRRIVYVTPSRIEAPNWLRDGRTLIFNSQPSAGSR